MLIINFDATLKVIEWSNDSGDVLFFGLMSFRESCEVHIKFPKPISIKRRIKYEIEFGFNGCRDVGSYVDFDGARGEEKSPKGLHIKFHDLMSNKNNNFITCLELMDPWIVWKEDAE